jgi:hypothetical protein
VFDGAIGYCDKPHAWDGRTQLKRNRSAGRTGANHSDANGAICDFALIQSGINVHLWLSLVSD